ncbi:capsule assembly Wzi family protein [Mucilaginibacter ximonensis]|uniref:Capsule assembly Wzi family protein n=1 Tax=Mucilaginibacter ximonensis TaxID=538021 RepID=A0ABW5YFP2_9SPHI
MKIIKLLVIFQLVFWTFKKADAQSLPVGTPAVEDYFRRLQLFGKTDSTVSFMVRPIFPNDVKAVKLSTDSIEDKFNLMGGRNKDHRAKPLFLTVLPVGLQTEVNSHNPYGWNDGAMIPAKGFQTLATFGFYAEVGPLSVQLKPEIVMAQNLAFETFNNNQYDVIFARYYDIYNNIDLPVRFGQHSYTRAYWGQSAIRLNYKGLSVGLSTENLWYGPGIRNSLLMSNSAPGFPHITLNTIKPIKTAIGSFEGQLIGGRLDNSNFAPLVPDHYYYGSDLYVPKPDNWRYLSGLVLTWQPKWVSGLFLGYAQTAQSYGYSLSGIKSYLPWFVPVKSTTAPDQPINAQDQLSSIFMRWIWAPENAEIYFEYGHYNNRQDIYQSVLQPNNSRAYVAGLRKLLPFKQRTDQNIMIAVEVTQMQETSAAAVKSGQSWYVSQGIRQGYTNQGQPLGAGIGPGGNLQSVEVSWVSGLKKIGLQLERYVHNNDFYYYAFYDSQNYSQHWVDLALAFNGEWNYRNFIFNAKLQFINSLNYQWALTQNGNDITFSHQLHQYNVQLQTGITYRF